MLLKIIACTLCLLIRLINGDCILIINEVNFNNELQEVANDFVELKAVGCQENERPHLQNYAVVAFSATTREQNETKVCEISIRMSKLLASERFQNDSTFVVIYSTKADQFNTESVFQESDSQRDTVNGIYEKNKEKEVIAVALLKSKDDIMTENDLSQITNSIIKGNIDGGLRDTKFDFVMYTTASENFEPGKECVNTLYQLMIEYDIYNVIQNMSLSSCNYDENMPLNRYRFGNGSLTPGAENTCTIGNDTTIYNTINDSRIIRANLNKTDISVASEHQMNVFIKVPQTRIDHFFNTRPFYCDWDAPRIPVVVDDTKLLILLPYHIAGSSLILTIFDFWTDKIYNLETTFPFSFVQLNQGIFNLNYLYVYGAHDDSAGSAYFVCRFNFVDNQWSVLMHNSFNVSTQVFLIRTKDGIQGYFNYKNGGMVIMNANQENEIDYCKVEVTNRPALEGSIKAPSGDRVFALGFDKNAAIKMSYFDLPSLTWKHKSLQNPQMFHPYQSIGYWNIFVRNDILTLLIPFQNETKSGTKVWQLDLKNTDDGWFERDPLSETVVWTIYDEKSDELYAVYVANNEFGSGYMLSAKYWRFADPNPTEVELESLLKQQPEDRNGKGVGFTELYKKFSVIRENEPLITKRFTVLKNMSLVSDVDEVGKPVFT